MEQHNRPLQNAWIQQEIGAVDRGAAVGVPSANGRPFAGEPEPTDVKYRIVDIRLAKNGRLAVSEIGSTLGFKDNRSDFLLFINTRVTDDPVRSIMEEWDHHYLHPIPDSEPAEIGAGLFMR